MALIRQCPSENNQRDPRRFTPVLRRGPMPALRAWAEGRLTRRRGVIRLLIIVNVLTLSRFRTSRGFRVRTVLCMLGAMALLLPAQARTAQSRNKTRHVILVTTDGLRQEEVFQGADEILISKQYGNVGKTNELKAEFWRSDPGQSREVSSHSFGARWPSTGNCWVIENAVPRFG